MHSDGQLFFPFSFPRVSCLPAEKESELIIFFFHACLFPLLQCMLHFQNAEKAPVKQNDFI